MPAKGYRSTHCKRGHELTAENTKQKRDRHGNCYQKCRTCYRVARRNTRKHNPVKARIRSLAMYGLTPESFQRLMDSQEIRCKICTITFQETPHIDHDRSCCPGTGSCGKCIRGLLCRECNVGIGMLGDDPALLQAALDHVKAGPIDVV